MQAREFANELRASTKTSRNPTVWLEASTASNQSAHAADTSSVSDAYAKMLTIFIPLLVDEVVTLHRNIGNLQLLLDSEVRLYPVVSQTAEFFFCTFHVL